MRLRSRGLSPFRRHTSSNRTVSLISVRRNASGRNFSLRDGALDIVSDPAPVEFLDGAMAIGILTWVREDGVRAADARG